MKVLQMHNHQQSKGGAMEVLAHERELLQAAGHDVQEYTLAATEDLGLSPVRAAAKAVWNVDAAREVRQRIEAFGPDVVHVHTPFPLMSPAVFRVAHRLGVPTVTTLHSYRWSCVAGTCFRDGHVCEDCVGSKLKLAGVRHRCYHDSAAASGALTVGLGLHRALGTQARCVDRWLTLTGFAKRLLVRDGIDEDKIVIKPNSVPDPGIGPGPTSDGRIVLFAARLLEIKGVRTLLQAWPQVSGQGLRLVVVGDGTLRPEVEELAKTSADVEFRGWVSEGEVTQLMASAEAVLMPSEWYEGLPLVILRSLSVGTPVLTSDLENFAEDVLADHAGESFRTGDSQALAAALRAIAADPQRMAARRGAARRSYEERYSPEADVGRLEAVYAEVSAAR